MASQSIMVPPNNAPWPGLQTPSSSSSTPPSSSAPGATSAYPYHPSYYHHPHHPPPPPHHPSSHHQSYYPYHPYPGSPYPPPYPPAHSGHSPSLGSHGHPHPSHPFTPSSTSSDSSPTASSRHRLQAPGQLHRPRSSSPSTRSTSSSPTNAAGPSETQSRLAIASKSSGGYSAKSKPDKTKQPILKTKSGRSGTSDSSRDHSATTNVGNGASAPKVFRFEGSISSETYKTTKSFDLAGVNILNRKPLDTKTALDKLQRRRETHNRVERKRRDCINQLIDDLTKLLPAKHLEEATSKCHRVNVLRGAVAHITYLTEVNGTLVKSLKEVKGDDFDVGNLEAGSTAADSATSLEKKETEAESRDMSMDVDADVDMEESEPAKEEEDEEDEIEEDDDNDMDDKPSRDQDKKQSVSAPKAPSSSSPTPSPRLTPSRAMDLPPVIITDAPSPASDRGSSQSQLKMVPPPISIIPSDSFNAPQSAAVSPASSYTTSPLFPASPSSPYQSQRSPSASPALPPISSLANLHLQSPPSRSETGPASERRRQEDHRYQPYQHHGEHLSPSSRPAPPDSAITKSSGHRSGPTLPPLKIPAPHHLHPSYSSDRHSGQPSSSPRYHERSSEMDGEQQPPVSPFMLSPMLSRSPSMGPLSASSAGTSPYPHWGHEETSPGLPPHHGHYLPAGAPPPHSPHAYPGYPPYPYPYHPSYGYPPHPHAPPPPLHHHHGHHPSHAEAAAPRHAASTAAPQPSRSLQPEPIFIQEEPWVVQRKRSTSNVSSKNPPPSPSPSAAASLSAGKTSPSRKGDEEFMEDNTTKEGSVPLSPSSSVTSSVSSSFPGASPNHRKRSAPHKTSYDEGEEVVSSSMEVSDAKRVKQQEQQLLGADLEENQQLKKGQQRDSGIVVVVVDAENEASSDQNKD